jgi:MSHA biogenesis protein MshM
MYLEHFGLVEAPFRITPHTEFFFTGANRGATLEALLYAAAHDEGIIKISGEVGSGKTMLCRVLMERLPKHVAIVYLSNPSLSPEDIFYAIADELALTLPENARASVVLKLLQNHLISLYAEGRRVVVLIDEAHAMPTATLEEIRLLSNLESKQNKLLQLVLFGQPELNEILARSDMRQLKERITHNFELEPLVRNDVAEYIEFRMRAAGYKGPNVFSSAATKRIHDVSKGLTRRVNILADKALLAAFAAGTHQITLKEVRAAVRDCDFSKATGVPSRDNTRLRIAIFVALAVITAVIIAAVWNSKSPPPSAAAAKMENSPENGAINNGGTTLASVAAMTGQNNPNNPVSTSTIPTPLTAQAMERGRVWLASAQENHWFLQLYGAEASNAASVEEYLQKLTKSAPGSATVTPSENIHVYLSDLSGKMRYGVIYGDYPDRDAALVAIGSLPSWVQSSGPYPRQVKRLR